MKTKTIELYSYDELSDKAKEKALSDYRSGNDYMFMEDCMNERLWEMLGENDIKIIDEDDYKIKKHDKYNVLYSLSNSQGDGAMFTGKFYWKNYRVEIKHVGRYYHSNSKDISITTDDQMFDEASEEDYEEFEKIYKKICKQLEDYGYDWIEYEDSEEHFRELCEANEWTFRSNGVMENA